MRQTLLKATGLTVAVGLVCLHATRERQERAAHQRAVEELHQLSSLASDVAPLFGTFKGTAQHITINGQRTFFNVETKTGSVQAVLDRVKDECNHGDLGDRGSSHAVVDGNNVDDTPLTLHRVDQQIDDDEVGAELCSFRATPPQGGQSEKRVRYTLVHRLDSEHASVFTIATECDMPIEALFPMEGDAPGSDLAGVPRPRGARRVFTADVEGARYAVRIYETPTPLSDAMQQYNADMEAATWTPSRTIADASARSYLRVAGAGAGGGEGSIIASFTPSEHGGTVVALAPL